MLFYKISLVLALKVCTPAYRILPLYAGSFENLYTLCIWKTYKLCVCNAFKACDELVVISVNLFKMF